MKRCSAAASIALLLSLSACAAEPTSVAAHLPRGASLSPDGFATILDAPPASFSLVSPSEPVPLTPAQMAAGEQFARVARFQNEVREEVEQLAARLRHDEKGNFVDLYYENEGEPSVVFRFLRNGRATLAKYTSKPHFSATDVRYSMEELRAAFDFMLATFRDDRVIAGGGIGSISNRADVEINIPEAEFRALVARKGVRIPDAVNLQFRAEQPATTLNGPLPTTIKPLVRIFPRSDRPLGILNAINSRAKIVLKDGCFRSLDQGNALVQFPLGANLFVDREGYLAFGTSAAPGYARVGETVITPGSIYEVTAPELVAPIHNACGAGKVIAINGTQSAAADSAQEQVDNNPRARQDFIRMYGLSASQAEQALARCKQAMGNGSCLTSPPPPVGSQAECPADTKLSGGLCRTPEGYIRPLPKWLAALLD